jgi:hypothetical protein
MSEQKLPTPEAPWAHQGNLLGTVVRRDIADLNRLFLDHALDPAHRADCWFQLPASAVERLAEATVGARERAAQSPISLFELALPETDGALPWRHEAVTDGDLDEADRSRCETRRSFGLVALLVARRLAEGVPLSSRIAFGLAPAYEARLSALSPSESFRLASWPGLVRPRWPGHARYWDLLAAAATGAGNEVLHWAYSAGLCLLGQCEREQATSRPGQRRLPRPGHRRGSPGGTDVPC